MHAKTSKEIIHATWYLQAKGIVTFDPDDLLCFPIFPLPSCSKFQVCHTALRLLQEKLQVSKSMRERE